MQLRAQFNYDLQRSVCVNSIVLCRKKFRIHLFSPGDDLQGFFIMHHFSQQEIKRMRHALDLARKGAGYVLPNPMVGAVIVKEGKTIGAGFHERFGGAHAEVNALAQAGSAAKRATLYVTLEPCSHYGKTPPCVDAILAARVARVVVAMQDPNPQVAGNGIARLQEQGVQVDVGLLTAEAVDLNKPFIKFITKHRPFVTLKIAQTLDGRIADAHGASRWISSVEARKLVHQWRFEAGAVLVGIGTVLQDDPRLTIRHADGPQPFRIVLDRNLRIPLTSQLLTDEFAKKTILITSDARSDSLKIEQIAANGARLLQLPLQNGRFELSQVLAALAELGIAHIFIEGGADIASAFLQANSVDRLCVFVAPKIFGAGKTAFQIPGYSAKYPLQLRSASWCAIGPDMLLEADVFAGEQEESRKISNKD